MPETEKVAPLAGIPVSAPEKRKRKKVVRSEYVTIPGAAKVAELFGEFNVTADKMTAVWETANILRSTLPNIGKAESLRMAAIAHDVKMSAVYPVDLIRALRAGMSRNDIKDFPNFLAGLVALYIKHVPQESVTRKRKANDIK